jgi:putative addiction module killer protein
MGYTSPGPEVLKSATFDTWFTGLKDRKAKARIAVRIDRLALGNPGDVKPVGSGVSEMRIDYGPGYRVYFTQRGPFIIVVLCGGDKRTQDADIKRAIEIAASWEGASHGNENEEKAD